MPVTAVLAVKKTNGRRMSKPECLNFSSEVGYVLNRSGALAREARQIHNKVNFGSPGWARPLNALLWNLCKKVILTKETFIHSAALKIVLTAAHYLLISPGFYLHKERRFRKRKELHFFAARCARHFCIIQLKGIQMSFLLIWHCTKFCYIFQVLKKMFGTFLKELLSKS